MRTRLSAIVAVAGIAVAVIPAHAGGVSVTAGPTPQILDQSGDANFINGENVVPGAPDQATPADQSSADITSVLFQSTYVTQTIKKKVTVVVKTKKGPKKVTKILTFTVKVPTGFTVTMNLSAAPGPGTLYRVNAAKGACTQFFFQYTTSQVSQAAGTTGELVCRSGEEKTTYTVAPPSVTGSSITWTVPLSQIPFGTQFTGLGAMTAVDASEVTAPFYDLASGSGTFTVGK